MVKIIRRGSAYHRRAVTAAATRRGLAERGHHIRVTAAASARTSKTPGSPSRRYRLADFDDRLFGEDRSARARPGAADAELRLDSRLREPDARPARRPAAAARAGTPTIPDLQRNSGSARSHRNGRARPPAPPLGRGDRGAAPLSSDDTTFFGPVLPGQARPEAANRPRTPSSP